jgi:hypothetical protein
VTHDIQPAEVVGGVVVEVWVVEDMDAAILELPAEVVDGVVVEVWVVKDEDAAILELPAALDMNMDDCAVTADELSGGPKLAATVVDGIVKAGRVVDDVNAAILELPAEHLGLTRMY